MKIYLDTCCYGRPYDDPDTIVIAETFAIRSAISICETEGFPIIGSPTLVLEISKISDNAIRQLVQDFYNKTVTKNVPLTAWTKARARMLQAGNENVQGLKVQDSFHAALAEAAGVTYLLTTDIKFEKKSAKLGVKTNVINPINFIQEYSKWLLSLT